jgi:hypothetical protein
MFSDLPPDIVLEILFYLPLTTIASLALVSCRLHSVIIRNENPIYHRASFYHGHIPSCTTSLDKASRCTRRSMGPWTDLQLEGFLCVNLSIFYHLIVRMLVTKARNANTSMRAGPAKFHLRLHPITGREVGVVRLDEATGYIFASSIRGGLFVTDMVTGEDLWSLPAVGTHLLYNQALSNDRLHDG